MNSVKVSDRLPNDWEVALILCHMASGPSSDEFEKVKKLQEEFKKRELVKRLITNKSAGVEYDAKVHLTAVKVVEPYPKKALAIKNNKEIAPLKKRGRPFTSKVTRNSEGHLKIENNVTEWQALLMEMIKCDKTSQMRENAEVEKFRLCLMGHSADSYQTQFLGKFVSKV